MTLAAIIIAALLAVPTRTITDADTVLVADAYAEEAHQAPLWTTGGERDVPAGEAATGAILAAIVAHEGGMLQTVRDCRVTGDKGKSIGLTQLMAGRAWAGYSRGEICGSDALQARLALAVLRANQRRSPRASAAMLLRGYASGSMGTDSAAARELAHGFWRQCQRAGLWCDVYGAAMPRWVR